MKVLTIGEILVEVMRKELDKPLDRPGELVGPFPSGAPAIFADAVSNLGVESGIVGVIADDEFGLCIRNRLEDDGVDLKGIKTVAEPATGVAFVSYQSDGQRSFLYHMSNSAAGTINKNDISREFFEGIDLLHINGSSLAMGKNMREVCYRGVEIAKKEGAKVSFDPNLRPELLGVEKTREICSPVIKHTDALIPGQDELKGIMNVSSVEKAVEKTLKNGTQLVAVKDGPEGCKLYKKNQTVRKAAFEFDEVDPTGAGDAFSAAIVVGWIEGMPLEKLALFANAMGGFAVTKIGPMEGIVGRKKVMRMIEETT